MTFDVTEAPEAPEPTLKTTLRRMEKSFDWTALVLPPLLLPMTNQFADS